ncbi:sigma-54-dependent Fis family transcriptional regulator [Geovibrio thiophilus]|uniref:Sigma-54-dependent Fis family transcriptional regulator n=1 Tax=Geovibrio thiophilus TaxID=139438 RepID=A0A3R5UZE4_9BACT|nr:sigma-54 dependent transcriptional regulator [Geovibrio thiophilus]QAR33478.1 sigma-54-dependent Fis family transcriptional regulator [Geovibrio thiophilus]
MIDFNNYGSSILLVDDEKDELEAYSFLLQSMGIKNITALEDSREVMSVLRTMPSPVVFLDLNMPHKSGQEVLREIKEQMPHVPVIICTANSEIEVAVECLKLGAHDYLVKPINMNTFSSALRNAHEISALRSELLSMKGMNFGGGLRRQDIFSRIVTRNAEMHGIFQYIEAIAVSGQPVLILGETGSGKEMISRAIHDVSGFTGEFVAVDVSGLDDTLFSDTLFGHAKGAYTGADSVRSGLIEKARQGTIFLDEIGDLSEVSQVKLLRLLQERIYYPLGSDKPKRCEARIIAAANKDLSSAASSGGFRRDLYYRLSTHLIKIPPLRERKEDIPLIANYLAEEAAKTVNKPKPEISREAMSLITSHTFPGNIRELKTYIYDAVVRCTDGIITENIIAGRLGGTEVLPAADAETVSSLEKIFGRFPTLDEVSEYAVSEALKASENMSQAARLLGISKQALHKRLKKRTS